MVFPEYGFVAIFSVGCAKKDGEGPFVYGAAQLNIGEIAASDGYSNASNFTTAFRKQYGCNPSEYVKRINQLDVERSKL
ncbi:helix-turn-helix domain-containing protein [Cohnella nanjingensis]|uniref:Helix-turn-helix transcriptional regulator n=1 Tax=Cohnella nanjingensis TaxID=1387779 RepID=A0A7X0RP27_9BACL|nr:AraC family transcriptional regulator [Cohnella nanjingensis]MBB6669780.1 helix-turn-helix transcriptional regulator [Cohnella nanjingensis]